MTHRDTRIVAVSGLGQERDRSPAYEAGFDAYLAKPLDLTDLDALLHRWTNGWTAPLPRD